MHRYSFILILTNKIIGGQNNHETGTNHQKTYSNNKIKYIPSFMVLHYHLALESHAGAPYRALAQLKTQLNTKKGSHWPVIQGGANHSQDNKRIFKSPFSLFV